MSDQVVKRQGNCYLKYIPGAGIPRTARSKKCLVLFPTSRKNATAKLLTQFFGGKFSLFIEIY
jgi:hypothetical protein